MSDADDVTILGLQRRIQSLEHELGACRMHNKTLIMEQQLQKHYAEKLPTIRGVARSLGYAIGLHGSMVRDLDLIAVPWTHEAAPASELVEAVRLAVNGVIVKEDGIYADRMHKNPAFKPHGRLAWSIQIGGGRYIDLSVMPREQKITFGAVYAHSDQPHEAKNVLDERSVAASEDTDAGQMGSLA